MQKFIWNPRYGILKAFTWEIETHGAGDISNQASYWKFRLPLRHSLILIEYDVFLQNIHRLLCLIFQTYFCVDYFNDDWQRGDTISQIWIDTIRHHRDKLNDQVQSFKPVLRVATVWDLLKFFQLKGLKRTIRCETKNLSGQTIPG